MSYKNSFQKNNEPAHALLSPSQHSWINYDKDKLMNRYYSSFAQDIGTAVHEYAENSIKYRIKFTKQMKNALLLHLVSKGIPERAIDIDFIAPNLYNYINDGIGFLMDTEQKLMYSDLCFGTADSIIFRDNLLRIHDLKTGKTPADMIQLHIYAALFCLEQRVNPEDIAFELRIYQANEIILDQPTSIDIRPLMEHIIWADQVLREGGAGNARQ